MSEDIERIAAELIDFERERLIGWKGCHGAAYNCISEDLCEMGLLNADWSLSAKGEAVRAHLLSNQEPAT